MTNRSLPAWPYPRTFAHRGAGKLAPENTLAAFRHGASFGYGAFEFDVKLSADGKSFLLHDATLERTTGGSGRAAGWCGHAMRAASSKDSRGMRGNTPAGSP